jgi:hypothetical protein
MRSLLLPVLLGLALLVAPERAAARPEFARREGKACGFCHINPRGGGARNATGLLFARNEFKFPARKGDLKDFERERDRKSVIRARKLIDLQHIKAAVTELKRLSRSVKGEAARKAVLDALHDLDVKGTEILGQARRMLRKPEEAGEGVELLVVLDTEYRSLDVHAQAVEDLRELRRDKERREAIRREQREAKARLLYLDARVHRLDGKERKAQETFAKVLESYADTRSAKLARKEIKSAGKGP